MDQPNTTPTAPHIPAHGPVVFPAPQGGWSQQAYRNAIHAFVRARGRAPQTVTMHPQNLGTVTRMFVRRKAEKVLGRMLKVAQRQELGLKRELEDAQQAVTIVTSDEHDRNTIVMT